MKNFHSMFLGALAIPALLALPAAAAPTTWTIDPAHSVAAFTVKHLSVTKVRGELGTVTGTVIYDAADPAKGSVDASIDVRTVSTHNEGRDKHLNSPDFFDTVKFPTATFKSTSITKSGDKLTITGNLTLHGVTKQVTIEGEGPAAEVKHPMMKDTFVSAFSGKTKINRKDFGIAWGPDAIVSDEVQIELDLEVDRKG